MSTNYAKPLSMISRTHPSLSSTTIPLLGRIDCISVHGRDPFSTFIYLTIFPASVWRGVCFTWWLPCLGLTICDE
jgi:hypothetical protein